VTEGLPPKLNYSTPGTEAPVPLYHPVRRFFVAIIIGCIISGVVWGLGWHYFDQGGGAYLIFLIPGIKIVAAIALLFYRQWRTFAAGLLVSVALGALIWMAACFANFKWH